MPKKNNKTHAPSAVKSKKGNLFLGGILLFAVVIIAIFLYATLTNQSENSNIEQNETETELTETEKQAPIFDSVNFANYSEYKTSFKPKLESIKIEPDFSNVLNYSDFEFSAQQQESLRKNYFFVSLGKDNSLSSLYEKNRQQQIPSFITSDAVLFNVNLIFDYVRNNLEKDYLQENLIAFSDKMYKEFLDAYQELENTEFQVSALKAMGIFNVGSKILQSDYEVNNLLENEVSEEFSLIQQEKGPSISPIKNLGVLESDIKNLDLIDYEKFKSQGHYAVSGEFQNYHKALAWYSNLQLDLENTEDLKTAILISHVIKQDKKIFDLWESVYQPELFFSGNSQNFNVYELVSVMDSLYGKKAQISDLTSNVKLKSLQNVVNKMKKNNVYSFAQQESNKNFSIFEAGTGLNDLISKKLVYDATGKNNQGKVKNFLSALDLPAALGSTKALEILQKNNQTDYQDYLSTLEIIKNNFLSISENQWTQNLSGSLAYSMLDLLDIKSQGYPDFINSELWINKSINTIVSGQTSFNHDYILLKEQNQIKNNSEINQEPSQTKDDRGYVEPYPLMYSRLASVLDLIKNGLNQRNLLSENNLNLLKEFKHIFLKLSEISEKELENIELSDDECEFIENFGKNLNDIWNNASLANVLEDGGATGLAIINTAYQSGDLSLQQAIGKLSEIYVLVPVENKLKIAKGGVFSYFEFEKHINEKYSQSDWFILAEQGGIDQQNWQREYLVP